MTALRIIAIAIFAITCALLILVGWIADRATDSCVCGKPVAICGALLALCGMVILLT